MFFVRDLFFSADLYNDDVWFLKQLSNTDGQDRYIYFASEKNDKNNTAQLQAPWNQAPAGNRADGRLQFKWK